MPFSQRTARLGKRVGVWLAAPIIALLGCLLAAGCLAFLLHNWSPARMDWNVPQYLEIIASHLQDLMEHLSIDLKSICLWTPTMEKRQTFRVSVKYAGAAELREHVIDSVD